MNQDPVSQLRTELETFHKLDPITRPQVITDAYHRILAIVQAIMLASDNPDAHARAWSLLNDDAYKDLAAIQEGKTEALTELKFKISQVGELLLMPED